MKILITGAAGQIGSGLAKRICEKHELTLVDNLRNGYASHLKDDEGEFIEIGRAHVRTPVTRGSRMPSSA